MITVEEVNCSKCRKSSMGFYDNYDRDVWFSKYIKDGEGKICFDCIKNRRGFRKEFKSLIGVSVNDYEKTFRR